MMGEDRPAPPLHAGYNAREHIVGMNKVIATTRQAEPQAREGPEIVPFALASIERQHVDRRARRSQRLHLVVDESSERRHLGRWIHVGDDQYPHCTAPRSQAGLPGLRW